MTVILQAEGLRKAFGGVTALADVSLTVQAGDRHAIIGPNGAGKTTLLNLLAGALRPTAGSVTWQGRDITRTGQAHRARAGIGRSFQTPTVIPSLSTVDNLVLAAWPHAPRSLWWPPRRQRRLLTRALHQLETVGLADHADQLAGVLAHGQRRLLDIAMALAGTPLLLLLDEPAAGLDDHELDWLLRLLAALPDAMAVVLVDLVAAAATTVTVLHQGAVITTGSHDSVVTHPLARGVYPGLAPTHGGDVGAAR
jgi:branched-chain amino acid transport system ATP-binding protein